MALFSHCYLEMDGAREELELVRYTLIAATLARKPGSQLGTYVPGDSLTMIFRPAKFETWKLELRVRAKVVGLDERWVHVALTDQSEMLVADGASEPEPMSFSLAHSRVAVTAYAKHPWFISHSIEFVVRGAAKRTLYLEFLPSRVKDVAVPELRLELRVQMPSGGTYWVRGEIERIWGENGTILTRFGISASEKGFSQALSLRILEADPKVSIEDLLEAGFQVPEFKGHARSGILFTESEIGAALELRKRAYVGKPGSKLSPELPAEAYRDRYDDFAMIIGVRLGSCLLGTGRIVFNFGNLEQSEIAGLGAVLPRKVLDAGFVEVSRFATDGRFRRRDVFRILMLHAFREAILSGHRFIVLDCEDRLVPLYRRLGAKKLSQRITHPWEGVSLNILVFDLRKILRVVSALRHVPLLARRYGSLAKDLRQISRNEI